MPRRGAEGISEELGQAGSRWALGAQQGPGNRQCLPVPRAGKCSALGHSLCLHREVPSLITACLSGWGLLGREGAVWWGPSE